MGKIRRLTLLAIGTIVLTLCINGKNSVNAQDIFGINLSQLSWGNAGNIPIFNDGNFRIAPLFIDGKEIGFTVANVEEQKGNSEIDSKSKARSRSLTLSRRIAVILSRMNRYANNIKNENNITDIKALQKRLGEEMTVTNSTLNNTYVVLVAFPRNAPYEIVYTVTQADSQYTGLSPGALVDTITQKTRSILLEFWAQRQTPYLVSQLPLAGGILLSLMAITGGSILVQRKKIPPPPLKNISPHNAPTIDLDLASQSPPTNIKKTRLGHSLREPLFWGQLLLWIMGVGYICRLFYFSRPLGNWLLGISIYQSDVILNPARVVFPPLDWVMSLGQWATLGVPLLIILLIFTFSLLKEIGYALIDNLVALWAARRKEQAYLQTNDEDMTQRYDLRASTYNSVFRRTLQTAIYLLFGIFSLQIVGVLPSTIATIIGIFAFAVSFAAQNLLKDLINGFFIILEDQYAVGDWIAVDNLEGSVESIDLRTTRLRDLDGKLITIPNGTITRVQNLSNYWYRIRIEITIAPDMDSDKAMGLMKDTAMEMYRETGWEDKLLDPPEMLGVTNYDSTGVSLLIVLKTKPLQQWVVAREYRYRLQKVFDREGIVLGIPRQLNIVKN
ncbi:MAG: hypothetical protein N5P05_003718 [Chroococcopsis gigantea SAG 12.99]|jgi:small-conductance mechanosensitive channel|nr:hypothetical protein [Chroococcopsis gigantea SAG 12.99]